MCVCESVYRDVCVGGGGGGVCVGSVIEVRGGWGWGVGVCGCVGRYVGMSDIYVVWVCGGEGDVGGWVCGCVYKCVVWCVCVCV